MAWRPLQSLRSSKGTRAARSRRYRLGSLTVLLLGLLGAASAHAEADECGPFDERFANTTFETAAATDPGLVPSEQASLGPIVTLPIPPTLSPVPPAGEALLALPKGPNGELPQDFVLGDGARVAESFFSPVLCATVARVVGDPQAPPESLFAALPATGTVVANSVYVSAQAAAPTPVPLALREPDPYRSLQYGLDQLEIEAAHRISRGDEVRIAVLDSAPERTHRDLAQIDVARFEGGPGAAAAVHGTLVAGVIAAIADNGFGMAGIAPDADVVAVPVCRPTGTTAADRCLLFDLLRGLDKAWEREAAIINLSIVGPTNPLLERAMSRLEKLGALVVASSGNEGTDTPRYPAAYPSVIGVGALDRDRALSPRSNRGASAELLAPGVEVLSAVPGDAFAFGTGTSFASAHVTGILGVLVGAGFEPAQARGALFREAHESAGRPATSGAVPVPPVCAVLARLGTPCPTP